MKENLVYVKLGLLLIIAPIVIWTGALRATARSYREYRQLGKALDKALNHEATIDLSVVSDRDQLSSGEAIAGISSVSSYIPKVERSESGLTWVSARVEIKGGYHELLRALNTLEEDGAYKMTDISFERKDEREKQVTLKLTLNQLVRYE